MPPGARVKVPLKGIDIFSDDASTRHSIAHDARITRGICRNLLQQCCHLAYFFEGWQRFVMHAESRNYREEYLVYNFLYRALSFTFNVKKI